MTRQNTKSDDLLLNSVDSSLNYHTMEGGVEEPKKKQQNKLLKWFKITLIVLIVILLLLFLLVYVALPLTVYYSSIVRRNLLFFNFVTSAKGLSDPEALGLECSRNFFTTSDPGIRIGSWYMQSQAMPCQADREWFPGNLTTVLYLHGITKTRSAKNRVELMWKLTSEVKTHAVAIDYRGFGDSTNETPSLQGVVNDSLAAYQRLRKIMPQSKIIIWGHSLGTSVTMYLAAKLRELNDDPAAIILEAALDSVGHVITDNRLSKPFRWMPWFYEVITRPFETDPTTNFNSTSQVPKLNPRVPMLMLHAQDDATIPFENGLELYKAIRDARVGIEGAAPVTFVPFSASHKFGHSRIVFHDHFSEIVLRFLSATGPSGVQPVT